MMQELAALISQYGLLMIFALVLTLIQFRYIERNVNYDV